MHFHNYRVGTKIMSLQLLLFLHSLSASASLPHSSRIAVVSSSWRVAFMAASSLLSLCELGQAGTMCLIWDQYMPCVLVHTRWIRTRARSIYWLVSTVSHYLWSFYLCSPSTLCLSIFCIWSYSICCLICFRSNPTVSHSICGHILPSVFLYTLGSLPCSIFLYSVFLHSVRLSKPLLVFRTS